MTNKRLGWLVVVAGLIGLIGAITCEVRLSRIENKPANISTSSSSEKPAVKSSEVGPNVKWFDLPTLHLGDMKIGDDAWICCLYEFKDRIYVSADASLPRVREPSDTSHIVRVTDGFEIDDSIGIQNIFHIQGMYGLKYIPIVRVVHEKDGPPWGSAK